MRLELSVETSQSYVLRDEIELCYILTIELRYALYCTQDLYFFAQ